MKLHTFTQRKPAPNTHLIKKLEKMLSDAQNGDLLGLVGVAVYEGALSTCREVRDSEIPMIPAIIGAIEIIKFDFVSTTAIDDED